jgi:alpha-L-rhamnosidase
MWQFLGLLANALSSAVLFLLLITSVVKLPAQSNTDAPRPWNSHWITSPGPSVNIWSGVFPEELKEYGVYKFRKKFSLGSKPSSFIIHVSADNRYKLYVNGIMVSVGPARGDLFHWNYETVDIASHLRAGDNVLAAVVWNDGPDKPEAQISLMTAFFVQGNSRMEEVVNTSTTWKCIRDESYQPLAVKSTGYYVAGPGEFVDMVKQIRHWERVEYDDSSWKNARVLLQGLKKGIFTFAPTSWMLVPSSLPQMEHSPQRLAAVRKADGMRVPTAFPKVPSSQVVIPARMKVSLLLDNEVLTNAYPTLIFSGGKNATLSLTYAEALYTRKNENISGLRVPTMPKGNRNEIDGKIILGKRDSLVSDGTANQNFTTLWWRTYRYILLRVEAREEPLVINDIFGTFTGYPFQFKANFVSDDPFLKKNLEIGWRTARLCAYETYMDCPYYEQLQYVGDTRIQALVSLYNSGDDRLMRNAINQIDQSRLAEGITMSRYPTAMPQMIPTFSLWWIGMVHDYWRYRPDEEFVKAKLPGVRQVLSAFQTYQAEDGSLKNVPYWIFSDWVQGHGWKDGVAPLGSEGHSAMLDLQLLWAFQVAAELEENLGLKDLSAIYRQKAEQLADAIKDKYWDNDKGMFADTPEKNLFSQHTNSLAILTGLIRGMEATALGNKLLNDNTLAPASIYFKYYLHLALVKAGLGNDYLKWLTKWDENIRLGLTTWAEMSDVSRSRSDCHAWGSSPNIELFRIVLGIDSGAPGFKKVSIEPHLGDLKKVQGTIPHPNGNISVDYRFERTRWIMEITLPAGTEGEFEWSGRSYPLKEGQNRLQI